MTPASTVAATRTRAAALRRKRRKLPPWPILVSLQVLILFALLALWYVLVQIETLPKFIFGQPYLVFLQIWDWTVSGEILHHLWITLLETVLSFVLGSLGGLLLGLWLGLNPLAAAILDPYIKAVNSMPRVIMGPIFIVWFGLGIWSKVALGITLVFVVVFFNVFQGVREVNPIVLANARILGSNRRQLLRTVYIPSAMSWMFSSLHTSVGMAFVGAVVGEYLGSAAGMGYLILQAESVFDINAVFAGMIVLTLFALLLDFGVSLVERRLLGWRRALEPAEPGLATGG
jgi:NitT/TauT family transport system permease protein